MGQDENTIERMRELERGAVEGLLGGWQDEPLLIVFFIPLREPLELAHHSTYSFERDEIVDWLVGLPHRITDRMPPMHMRGITDEGRNYVSLLIWRPRGTLAAASEPLRAALRVVDAVVGNNETSSQRLSESMPDLFANQETYDTVVEAVTPLIREPGQSLEDVVSSALDRCLEELAALMRAYLLMTRNHRVQPVTRQNVYPFVPYTIQDPYTGDRFGIAAFRANELVGWSSPATVLPGDKHSELMIYTGRLKAGDPVSASTEWARLAWRGYNIDGDFRVTVMASHTSAETMFDVLLLMAAYEEGTTSPETAAGWFKEGLVQRVSKHYAARFGGPWQPADPNTVIGSWVVRANKLRHRVIHGGYNPTQSEARAALDAHNELEEYLKKRLASKCSTYPRTTLMTLGVPGLQRLGLYSKNMRGFTEQFEPTALSWLADYKRWVQQVDALRIP